jgi:signal transduction histidine kinase
VINDVLDYSKLSSETLSINCDNLNIADIINSVIRSSQTIIKSSVSLQCSLHFNVPTVAKGESLRFCQVIQNLISNATNSTDSGFIIVTAILKERTAHHILFLPKLPILASAFLSLQQNPCSVLLFNPMHLQPNVISVANLAYPSVRVSDS